MPIPQSVANGAGLSLQAAIRLHQSMIDNLLDNSLTSQIISGAQDAGKR
jgi:hypothetical protein